MTLAAIILGFSSFLLGAAAVAGLSLLTSWVFDALPPVTDEDLQRVWEALRG